MANPKRFPKLEHLNDLVMVTTSFNVARTQIIGPGGLRVSYYRKPSEKDIEEVRSYLVSKLPMNTEYHDIVNNNITNGMEEERAAYLRFLEED